MPVRACVNSHWDEHDSMMLFESLDYGHSWKCKSAPPPVLRRVSRQSAQGLSTAAER